MKYESKEERLEAFLAKMVNRKAYKSKELNRWSSNLSRDLKELEEKNLLTNAGHGIYYQSEKLGSFNLPVDENSLLEKFLNDSKFMTRTYGEYNDLRLGTTQHTPNLVLVYNKKRDGVFTLDGKTYVFKRKKFPSKNFDEFLLVDMLNNLENLGEDKNFILDNLKKRWASNFELDKKVILFQAKRYGKYWVKKFFEKLGNYNELTA